MTTDIIYPLTFDPIFKDYPWGGRNLGEKLGRAIPEGIVAESWEIAAHPNGSSTVNNGALAGLTLPQVQEKLGLALVGKRNEAALAAGKFPLLIKFLDANRWLSVQVHPDDTYALAHGGDWGKTEMWVFLDAEPQAEIIYGFKPGVTREKFAQAVTEGKTTDLLHRLPVKAGDVAFVPSGAIHALGPGTLIAEIQQNSDVTYRIDDWGRPRPLHIEQSLDVLDFDLVEPSALQPKVLLDDGGLRIEQIGQCDYFETERLTIPDGSSFYGFCDGATFEIWAVLSGEVTLSWQGEPMTIKAVNWVLLPADLGEFQMTAEANSVLLRVVTPEAEE
ncbi:MAG: class I mannose-6-phosphate isomerase [Chloroflexi bacterium]|nr:class I mannose-6-phosphate isomerase [Chloroflexota bacterium]